MTTTMSSQKCLWRALSMGWGGNSLNIVPHLKLDLKHKGKERDIKIGKSDFSVQRLFAVLSPSSADIESSGTLVLSVYQKHGPVGKELGHHLPLPISGQ
ncbi:hypothetical protein [Vibrio neptunius]|uniref:hypothetical protein n=1 Tax=Vibrio neptunius TaxID=170651 RepID=UPI003CE52289